MTCNANELEVGQFMAIQDQNTSGQFKAHCLHIWYIWWKRLV